jgi:nucleoside-diphosphate-sugar epimerase
MTENALIGYTGFVGSNLARQANFNAFYNSTNIHQIDGKRFDLVVCTGARAEKWKANQEPESDLSNIEMLISHLKCISSKTFILISTVDVYQNPQGVYEDSPITLDGLSAYGKNRFRLEEAARTLFPHTLIIRLPGLFGAGLKKNFVFDLLHKSNALALTHFESQYQFYGLDRLWDDIQTVSSNGLNLVNLATPPVSARQIAQSCFDRDFINETPNMPVLYDMRTRFAEIFKHPGDYIWSLDEELGALRLFAGSHKDRSA